MIWTKSTNIKRGGIVTLLSICKAKLSRTGFFLSEIPLKIQQVDITLIKQTNIEWQMRKKQKTDIGTL